MMKMSILNLVVNLSKKIYSFSASDLDNSDASDVDEIDSDIQIDENVDSNL